jgi:hypothetical protein
VSPQVEDVALARRSFREEAQAMMRPRHVARYQQQAALIKPPADMAWERAWRMDGDTRSAAKTITIKQAPS